MSLSLLAVHAHPDDESSKGAGTVHLYSSQGIRTTLVCCTGGEVGDILNPAMDRPEVIDNLQQVRREELDRALGSSVHSGLHSVRSGSLASSKLKIVRTAIAPYLNSMPKTVDGRFSPSVVRYSV